MIPQQSNVFLQICSSHFANGKSGEVSVVRKTFVELRGQSALQHSAKRLKEMGACMNKSTVALADMFLHFDELWALRLMLNQSYIHHSAAVAA